MGLSLDGCLQAGNPDGEFAAAVARDGRSFKVEVFQRAASILQRNKMVDAASIEAFTAFVAAAQAQWEAIQKDEALLGEVPEMFLDEWT